MTLGTPPSYIEEQHHLLIIQKTPHSINPTEPLHSELQKYKLERNGLVNKKNHISY